MDPFLLNIFIRVNFVIWITIGALMFSYREKRKPYFILKMCLCLAVIIAGGSLLVYGLAVGADNLLHTLDENSWFNINFSYIYATANLLLYILFFSLIVSMFILCYKESFYTCLYNCVCGYVMYEIAVCVDEVIGLFVPSLRFIHPKEAITILNFSFQIILHILVMTGCYFLFIRKKETDKNVSLGGKETVLYCAMVVGLMIARATSSIFTIESDALTIVICLLACVTGISVLYIQFVLMRIAEKRYEKDMVGYFAEMRARQFDMAQKNIEAINIKCHDIKYQIMRMGNVVDPSYINELESVVNIYDSMQKTGNDAFDTIITDRKFYCNSNKIQLTVVCEGDVLSFISPADIYSVFGNLLDNATEYVLKLQEEKRIIKINVARNNSFIKICVENYCEMDDESYDESLPETTKDNSLFHGFGMLSVKRTVEKYGGDMSVSCKDNTFAVNILIPCAADA